MIKTLQKSPASEDYKFSIIIPTWNNLDLLKICLKSILENSRFEHQIIVHVNQGSDGTLDWLTQNFDGDITYSEENQGICYPLNYCAKLVQTSYYCYFNDDMYACPDWDNPLVEAIELRDDYLFFYSGTQIQPFSFWDESILAGRNYGTDPESFNEEKLLKEYSDLQKGDWSGATWPPNVVHIDLWRLVGGYSIEFSPGMYSDPDFSMKLWRIGVRDFRGFGDSRVYHFESKSTSKVRKNNGTDQFLAKWGISSRMFGKHYLKRGGIYRGPLSEVNKKSTSYKTDNIRSLFKRLAKDLFR